MEIDTIGEDEICLLTDTNQVVLSSDYLTLNRAPYIFTQDSAVTVPVEHTLDTEMGTTQYFPLQAFTVGLVDGQLVPNETTYFLDPSQITFLTNGTHILKTLPIQAVPNQELTTTDSDLYSADVATDPNFMKVTEFVLQDNVHLVNSIPQQTLTVDALSSTDDASYHPLTVPENENELLLESANIEPLEEAEAVTAIQQQDFEQQTVEQQLEQEERVEEEEERQPEPEDEPQPGPASESDDQALQQNTILRICSDMDVSPPLRKGPHTCQLCSRKYDSWSVFKKHMKSHLEDKPHRCKMCPATFNVPSNLLLHEATHNTDNLSCPIKDCLKRFNRLASLKAHLNSHQQEESLFCTECGDEFNNQLQLDKHATEHYQEWIKPAAKIHDCIHCGRRYGKESVLKEHMKCHYKMKTSLGVRKHKKKRRGMHLHECETCHKSFQKPSQLIRHKRIHTGEKPFKCDICSRAFNQKGSMKIHKLKHSGARPYQCDFCKAKFSQKGNLRAHVVRLHSIPRSEEKVFKCSLCTCVFRKISRLNAHVNRTHRGEIADETDGDEANKVAGKRDLLGMSDFLISKDSSDKENDDGQNNTERPAGQDLENRVPPKHYRQSTNRRLKAPQIRSVVNACTYCGKEFKKPSDLVRHIRIHTHEKPFKCDQCFRSFAVRSTLTTHLRTHTGDKRFCCFACNKMFSSQGSLKVHLKSHMREKRYLCKHCLEPFATIGERAVHMTNVHPRLELDAATQSGEKTAREEVLHQTVVLPEPLVFTNEGLMEMYVTASRIGEDKDRPYQCTMCDTRFHKTSNLKIHMRIHTGERPFKCDLCNRTFITNSVMKTHRKSHFGVRSFGCQECGKLYTTKATLVRHMETHNNTGKTYVCPYCSKTFKASSSCKSHIRSHSTIAIAQMFANAGLPQNGEPLQSYVDNVTNTEEGQGQHELLSTSVVGSEEKDAVDAMLISQNTYQLPDGTEQVINVEQNKTLHTLHAVTDTGETMMINTLPIQDDLTQESIRVIQESLNNQIFNLTSVEKEQSVNTNALFDQPFDQMVFSAITTLPTDQMSLEQVLPSSTNLRSILVDKTHSLEAVNVHIETEEHESAVTQHISEPTDSMTTLSDGANIITVINEHGMNETFHLNSSDNNQECEKPRCEVCEQTFNTQAQLRYYICYVRTQYQKHAQLHKLDVPFCRLSKIANN